MTGEKNRYSTTEKLWKIDDETLTSPAHDELVMQLLDKRNIYKLFPEVLSFINNTKTKCTITDSILNDVSKCNYFQFARTIHDIGLHKDISQKSEYYIAQHKDFSTISHDLLSDFYLKYNELINTYTNVINQFNIQYPETSFVHHDIMQYENISLGQMKKCDFIEKLGFVKGNELHKEVCVPLIDLKNNIKAIEMVFGEISSEYNIFLSDFNKGKQKIDKSMTILSEVPIYTPNKFIVGFWDVVVVLYSVPFMETHHCNASNYQVFDSKIDVRYSDVENIKLKRHKSRTKQSVNSLSCQYFIEAKPTIDSLGKTLRQLKLYQVYCNESVNYTWLCTPQDIFREAFESQGFKVIKPII